MPQPTQTFAAQTFRFLLPTISFCWLLFALPVLADPALPDTPLPDAFVQALKQAHIPLAHIGLVVWPLNSPTASLQVNAKQPFSPASTLKLVTTYAALSLLGPAYTWQTDVLTDGTIHDGMLDGNLYLRGNGDPSLTDERLGLLIHQLRQSGFQTISGDLIIDQHLFQSLSAPAIDNHPWHAYNALPAATLLDYDSSTVTIRNANGLISLNVEPLPPQTHVINQITLTPSPCDADWRDQIHTVWQPDHQLLTFSGQYPATCPAHSFAVTEDAPSALMASRFMEDWSLQGGHITGTWHEGIAPNNATVLLTFPSLPLATVLYNQNKYSNNIMARNVFLSLSPTPPANVDAADATIHRWLQDKHLDGPELLLDNGAGLSHTARISPDNMARLLRDAANSPVYPELAASLPIYAIDGTLKHRTSLAVTAKAHLKTGTLDGVKTLAGYLHLADGTTDIVVLFINDSNAAAGSLAQDALLDAVYQATTQNTAANKETK